MAEDFKELCQMLKSDSDSTVDQMEALLKDNKILLKRTDNSGATLLHQALIADVPLDKIRKMVDIDGTILQIEYRRRLPIHFALEAFAKEEIIRVLFEPFPESARHPDTDGRTLLHMILEYQPLHPQLVELAKRMITFYPDAMGVVVQGKLPLHIALNNRIPVPLLQDVLKTNLCASSVRTRDGKLPLHVAVENGFDASIISLLIQGYPGALLQPMATNPNLLVLEYAIRLKHSETIIRSLLKGGNEDNPKCGAYARAAATGLITRKVRSKETQTRPSKHAFKFTVKTKINPPIVVVMNKDDKVEVLKKQLYEVEGTPVEMQRLTYRSKKLKNGDTLSKCGIEKDSEVIMEIRYEILQQALRCGLADDLTNDLIELRPKAAEEENQNGVYPLQLALQCECCPSVIQKLVEKFPLAVKEPVSGSAAGEYPLHLALQKKYDHAVIKVLLKDVVPKDWDKCGLYRPKDRTDRIMEDVHVPMPLHLAIQSNASKETIERLLQTKCPITARDPAMGYSALDCVLACQSDRTDELFQTILQATQAERLNAVDQQGPHSQQPLHIAVVNNASVSILKTLCKLGPSALTKHNADRQLPIHLAVARRASFGVVRTLLEHSPASVYAKNGQGLTPAQIAVTHRAQPGVIFELARMGWNALEVRDAQRRSLLELAVNADAPTWIIQELLEVMPYESMPVNLLSGKWPNTKAAAEAWRLSQQIKAQSKSQYNSMNQMETPSDSKRPSVTVSNSADEIWNMQCDAPPPDEASFLTTIWNSLTFW